MHPHLKQDRAFVLRSVPYQDRHRILTALTENHGKISALARNCIQSRRFGGSLELFTASEWHFLEKPGSELPSLREASPVHTFSGVKNGFRKLSLGSAFCEILLHLAPASHPVPELFRLLSNSLAALEPLPDSDGESLEEWILINTFLAKIIQWSGHQPQLRDCLGCSISLAEVAPDARLAAVIEDAGWLCPSCRTHGELTAEALVACQRALSLPIRKMVEDKQGSLDGNRRLFRFLWDVVRYHIPGFDTAKIRSLQFLELDRYGA